MTKKSYLKIVYNIGARVDSALDVALREAAEKQGWACWASSCDRTTGERNLAFDRTQEEECADCKRWCEYAELLRECLHKQLEHAQWHVDMESQLLEHIRHLCE